MSHGHLCLLSAPSAGPASCRTLGWTAPCSRPGPRDGSSGGAVTDVDGKPATGDHLLAPLYGDMDNGGQRVHSTSRVPRSAIGLRRGVGAPKFQGCSVHVSCKRRQITVSCPSTPTRI